MSDDMTPAEALRQASSELRKNVFANPKSIRERTYNEAMLDAADLVEGRANEEAAK